MRSLEAVAARLARPDMLQGAALLFLALAFTLAIQWPTGSVTVNESWFAIAPVRLTLLSIGAMAWGAGLGARPRTPRGPSDVARIDVPGFSSREWRAEAVATVGALLVLVLITLPFEVATHAASYPDVNLAWSLGIPALAVVGYFGAGIVLGRAADLLRVGFLLVLMVPLTLAATAWLDVSLERTVLNPWTASLAVSVPFAAALGGLSLVTLVVLLPPRREPGSSGGSDGASDAGALA